MQGWTALLGILAAMSLGVMSPGPSFVMVARTAVARSRRHGLAAALGMGVGGLCFSTTALLGLQAILQAVPMLTLAIRLGGGLYLMLIGWRLWRGAGVPLAVTDLADAGQGSACRSFGLGLATQVSNPKTAIVYGSVFAAFLPPDPGLGFCLILVLCLFGIELAWYSTVALVLSSLRPREVYLRAKRAIDRTAGGVMMALGAKLVLSFRG